MDRINSSSSASTSNAEGLINHSALFPDSRFISVNEASNESGLYEYDPAVYSLPPIKPKDVYNDMTVFHLVALERFVCHEELV